jgi:hypothetical protein
MKDVVYQYWYWSERGTLMLFSWPARSSRPVSHVVIKFITCQHNSISDVFTCNLNHVNITVNIWQHGSISYVFTCNLNHVNITVNIWQHGSISYVFTCNLNHVNITVNIYVNMAQYRMFLNAIWTMWTLQ